MKKALLILLSVLISSSGFSQTRKLVGDSIWCFSHPDFLTLREALDSSLFISSTYDRSNWTFVFSEDSMTVKSYLGDSLAETSPICEIIRREKVTIYKTHPIINGKLHDGQFTIFDRNKRKRKPQILTGGYSEPDITNGFIVFNPRLVPPVQERRR
jgi:hypothetical protein